jgi:hypothetical protein
VSLKILVIHSAGFVGKSTLTASLLQPRLPGAWRVYSVEQQNQDASRYGIAVIRYRATEFPAMWQDMVMDDSHVLVDVGASNYLAFMNQLRQVPGTINDFDLVIVPCTPDHRAQDETAATIDDLSRLGLTPEKLRVIFNRSAADGTPIEREYRNVVAYLTARPKYTLYEDLVLPDRACHTDLGAAGRSISEVLTDSTNYAAALELAVKQKADPAERSRLARATALYRAAQGAEADLQRAFEALRLPPSMVEEN